MQKTFSKELKFKVAMEAIRGDLTIVQIISKYQVSKTAIHEWKRLVLENGSAVFGQKKDTSPEKQVEQLHRIIGKLKVENDFLQDAWEQVETVTKEELAQIETPELSIRRKTELLKMTRSKLYYQPKTRQNEDKIIDKLLDIYEAHPVYGYRRMSESLRRQGIIINHKKVRKLMKMLNLKAIYPGPNTSARNHVDMVHPYLLKDLEINRFNQVWQTDISYIRVGNGFMYLTGIIDVYSRKALSYRVSNSLSVAACIDALEDATSKYGKAEIINSDQGSQYTSDLWIKKVRDLKIKISMTGKGRCNDNAYIERFWRTVKYEWLKLKFIPTVEKLKMELKDFMKWYNNERPHQAIGYLTPDEKAYGFMDKFYNLPTIPQAQQQII